MKKKTLVNIISAVTIIEVVVVLLVMALILHQNIIVPLFITIAFIIAFAVVYFYMNSMHAETSRQIEENVDTAYKEVLNHGDVGILSYDDNYEIIFMSEFFTKRSLNHVGEKLLNWLPELQDMLKNEANTQTIIINDDKFSVNKMDKASVLTFKDITGEYDLAKKLADEMPVLGLLSYDNYDEVNMPEDDLSYINSNIKVPVIDYFKSFNIVYNTLKNNRLLLILNEETFEKLLADRFSILTKVRKLSKEAGLDVTISMAFARGSENYEELDENAESLMELAQTRGGDQVVVRKSGEDAMFYGGNSEAREKQSKTKVRITANSIRDLILKSSNVIIVGHKEMDADCVASALCMSNIAMSLNAQTYIVSRTGGIESMISDVMDRYRTVLENKHHFISESDALGALNDSSLVIMVDHHSASTSNSPNLLAQAKRIIILDHHRRKADLDIIPMMMYIEAAASSATEITAEFLPYFGRKIEITPEEANIMYLGILIDTDHFRVRTGSRTFDVAKQLRNYGANPTLCEEMSEEPYRNMIERSHIINAARQYRKDVIVSSLNEGIFSRSIASQACDTIVRSRGVEAAFVICNIDKDEIAVSARSKGKINVQVIMEQLHGGGHMTAAGMQAKDVSVAKMEADLLKVLDDYFKGEENESNTAV